NLHWRYTHSPELMPLPVPLRYDVIVDYETEPNANRSEALDVEEEIVAYIEGPDAQWVRGVSEQVNSLIESTHMAVWWRVLRTGITKLKPFYVNSLFVGLFALAALFYGILFVDPERAVLANDILHAGDINEKFDLWVRSWNVRQPWWSVLVYVAVV